MSELFNTLYCNGHPARPAVEVFFPYRSGESYAKQIERMMSWLGERQATCAWRVLVSPLTHSIAVFEPDWKAQ